MHPVLLPVPREKEEVDGSSKEEVIELSENIGGPARSHFPHILPSPAYGVWLLGLLQGP